MFFIEKVIDWEKRIEGYTDAIKAKYRRGVKKFDELRSVLSDDTKDWSLVVDNKKKNLTCEQKESDRGYQMIRVATHSDEDVLSTWRAFVNFEMMYKMDPSTHSIEMVKVFGVNCGYGYQKTKKILTISSRDVYINVLWNQLQDGSIITVIFDETGDDAPAHKGCVRMRVPLSGALIVPDKSNPKKCEVKQVLEVSMEGKIPGYVMKAAIKDQAEGPVILRKHIGGFVKANAQKMKENPVVE